MDLLIQSASGLMSITGTQTGRNVKTGHVDPDITAGMFSLIADCCPGSSHRTGRGNCGRIDDGPR